MINPKDITYDNKGRWSYVAWEYTGGDYSDDPMVRYEEAEEIIEALEVRNKELGEWRGRNGSTHSADCYQFGPRHYECAMYQLEQAQNLTKELECILSDVQEKFCYDSEDALMRLEQAEARIKEQEARADNLRKALWQLHDATCKVSMLLLTFTATQENGLLDVDIAIERAREVLGVEL